MCRGSKRRDLKDKRTVLSATPVRTYTRSSLSNRCPGVVEKGRKVEDASPGKKLNHHTNNVEEPGEDIFISNAGEDLYPWQCCKKSKHQGEICRKPLGECACLEQGRSRGCLTWKGIEQLPRSCERRSRSVKKPVETSLSATPVRTYTRGSVGKSRNIKGKYVESPWGNAPV
jgi:hypothetical protein